MRKNRSSHVSPSCGAMAIGRAASAKSARLGAGGIGRGRQQVDAAEARERIGDAEILPRRARIGGLAAPGEMPCAGGVERGGQQRLAIRHQVAIAAARAIPFEHHEFGLMQRAALRRCGRRGRAGRCAPSPRPAASSSRIRARCGGTSATSPSPGRIEARDERVEMRLEAGALLQGGRVDLDEISGREEGADCREDARARRPDSARAARNARAATSRRRSSWRQPIGWKSRGKGLAARGQFARNGASRGSST